MKPIAQSLWSPELSSMCPFCWSWVLITVGTSMEVIDQQAHWLWVLALTTVKKLLCRGWPYRAGFTLTSLCDLSSLLWGCVIHWGSWAVLRYGLKLATGYICSGASWGELWCRPRSAISYILGSLDMGYRVICSYPFKG